jgi:hypothetical protein
MNNFFYLAAGLNRWAGSVRFIFSASLNRGPQSRKTNRLATATLAPEENFPIIAWTLELFVNHNGTGRSATR